MLKVFSLLLSFLLLCPLIQGCSAYNWPYYKLHASDARVINKSAFQYTIEISIHKEVTLQIASHCYPKSEEHFYGFQPCDIWVSMFSATSTNLQFASLDFVIENLKEPIIKYTPTITAFSLEDFKNTKAVELRPGVIRKKWLKIDLEYEHDKPPLKIKLRFPALIIEGKPYDIPDITGSYKRNTEFFSGLVNW